MAGNSYIVCALTVAAMCVAVASGAAPVVNTTYGPVTGTVQGSTTVFHAIPFAAPPVGDLRFRPPQPPTPWTEPVDGTTPAPSCMQIPILSSKTKGSEDCLTLNVYTPGLPTDSSSSSTGKPIMFWIYGGGYVEGGSWDDGHYDGVHMSEAQDVVVITANYRLGIFGFLSLPELQAEQANNGTGNMALLDQTAALQWVQANAARFGGDPSRVAIFGQSAGGFSICWHLVSPTSKGLFSAAIMESGSCGSRSFFKPIDQAFAFSDRVAASVGCTGEGAERLACLRSASPATLLHSKLTGYHHGLLDDASDASESWVAPLDSYKYAETTSAAASDSAEAAAAAATAPLPPCMAPVMPWGPAIDGVALLKLPLLSLQEGNFNKVPTIFGTNKNEGTIFVPLLTEVVPGTHFPPSTADMEQALPHFFKYYSDNTTDITRVTEEVLTMYPLSAYKNNKWRRASAIMTDWFFLCGTRRSARAIAAAGVPMYLYRFTMDLPWLEYLLLGDFHSAEIVLVFDNPTSLKPVSGNTALLSQSMQRYWASMAIRGSPNTADEQLAWPMYTEGTQYKSMNLTWPLETEINMEGSTCDKWDAILASLEKKTL